MLTTEDGQHFHLFLSAFLAFWDPVDDEGHAWVFEDYAGVRQVDYRARYELEGATIVRVSCAQGPSGCAISVTFDRGELSLVTVDPSDPHSDSRVSFRPSS